MKCGRMCYDAGMPVRDPINFPRCPRCQQPQYPELLDCHVALCGDAPYTGAGRPRKYPRGYKADYRPPALHGWGGARRGERWEWVRTAGAMRRGIPMGHITQQQAGHICHSGGNDPQVVGQRCPSGGCGREEMIPVAYVRALFGINRRTLHRWLMRYQIPTVRRRYPSGSLSCRRYLLITDLQHLLHLVYNRSSASL